MAYGSASQGGYGGGPTVIHTDASHADVVSISDLELLFTGHLERKGPDLVLTGHDGHRHIIPSYFSAEHPAALEAPNGARIAGDLVELLAGSQAPGQYAQDAQPQAPAPTNSIGRIEKVVGDVTVMRNGVAVALHVGDAVYKNDVVQTGADSSAGIGFPDGTALNLVSNTRMALNDYVYDPNGTSNDALFNLVQGGFAFVAGKVAHTGDMKIGTPVATMGIRGTTGYALQQVATVSANAGNVTMSFAVVADPGSDRVGAYVLIDQFGNEVAVDRAGIWTTLSWDGGNRPPTVSRAAMTASNFAIEQALVPALVQILNNINNLTPKSAIGPQQPRQLDAAIVRADQPSAISAAERQHPADDHQYSERWCEYEYPDCNFRPHIPSCWARRPRRSSPGLRRSAELGKPGATGATLVRLRRRNTSTLPSRSK